MAYQKKKSMLTIAGILVSLLALSTSVVPAEGGESCWKLEDAGLCGQYTEIGSITCYENDDPTQPVCATFPHTIIWPAFIKSCATSELGRQECEPTEINARVESYGCDGCSVYVVGVSSFGPCESEKLAGNPCP